MKEGLVSVIIVNWNGLRWLRDCFGSLAKQSYKSYEIIFVDNASNDGSVEWVKKHYPKTKIIVNQTNLGFAEANNVGYRVAKGAYVLFLNNDTRVTGSFMTELVKAVQGKSVAGAQSKILLMDKPDTHDSVGAFLTPTGFLYHYGFGKKDTKKYDKEIELYTAKGACMLFKKSVLDRVSIGGNIFDPDYFAYFEETDLCHRIWLAGYRIVYAYRSVIFHKMGATSSSMNNSFIQYHSFKNRIRTYLKNFGTAWLLTYLPIHILLSELYSMAYLFRGKLKLFTAIQSAFIWNISHFDETLLARLYVQKRLRKLSDKEISVHVLRKAPLGYYLHLITGDVQGYEE